MFVATHVAVMYGVDDPPGVIVIDDMFGSAVVVKVTFEDAVCPLMEVTVTVAVYVVPAESPLTARDVSLNPVYELGSPVMLYEFWFVDDQLMVAVVAVIDDAVTLVTVGIATIGGV